MKHICTVVALLSIVFATTNAAEARTRRAFNPGASGLSIQVWAYNIPRWSTTGAAVFWQHQERWGIN